MSALPEQEDDLDRVVRRLEAERYAHPIRSDRPRPTETHAEKRARLQAITDELDEARHAAP